MDIIDLISQWVSDPQNTTMRKRVSEYSKSDYHYYLEIIRHFNQIRFIVNKTLRSLPKDNSLEFAYYIYVTYCVFWKKSDFHIILEGMKRKINSDDEKILLGFYNKLLSWNWDISLKNKDELEILSIKYSAPTFFIQKLLPVLSYKEIRENIIAMDQRAREGYIYLRINNNQKPNIEITELRDYFCDYYKEIGINLKPVDNFPHLLKTRVQDKAKIVKDSQYKQKHLIFQEKASVASVYLLEPKYGETIVDLCAAPGIKTSLLSQTVEEDSRIIAGDFHAQRINEMNSFLSTQGITNVDLIQWDGIQPPLGEESIDRILLDAPCTGSGTFTSNPELKWRQSNKFLLRNVLLQEKLLKAALNALKVGGTLVYSVCSLYPEEGEHQIQKIIDQHVTPAVTPSWLPTSYKINNSYIKGTGRFLPAEHNTIGFFVAKIIKN